MRIACSMPERAYEDPHRPEPVRGPRPLLRTGARTGRTRRHRQRPRDRRRRGAARARAQRPAGGVELPRARRGPGGLMGHHPPVTDWATDFDHTDDVWAADPYPIWNELREKCPFAHTERYGGAWLPTRYDDISEIAYDTDHFTSRS